MDPRRQALRRMQPRRGGVGQRAAPTINRVSPGDFNKHQALRGDEGHGPLRGVAQGLISTYTGGFLGGRKDAKKQEEAKERQGISQRQQAKLVGQQPERAADREQSMGTIDPWTDDDEQWV